ncbi:MAG TPA: hypothetical protein VF495_23800 [Phenylobacterium sp.]
MAPLIRYEPSGWTTARVFISFRSVPQCGSVRHMVPHQSPLTIRGATCSSIQGAPVSVRLEHAPLVRPG